MKLTYTKKEKNAYLVSMAGQNIIYNIIGAGLAYYLQFTILIPAMIVGVVMTVARVWDAVNDFLMGTIVDKTRSKWGKCRPYLIFVPIPIFIATIICFLNFGFFGAKSAAMDGLIVAWAAFTYILFGMIYTVGDIPLWGVTALMTEDEHDRNKLQSLARVAGGIGGGITLLSMQPIALKFGEMLAPSMGSAAEGERWGFFFAALLFAVLGTALFQICGFVIKERIPATEKKPSLKENLKIIMGNRPFKQIMLSGILGSSKAILALVAMPLVTYYFASKNPTLAFVYILLLGGGMFLGQFVGMYFTPKLATKYSKKNLYNYSNLISILPYILVFVLYLAAPRGVLATNPVLLGILFILFVVNGFMGGVNIVLQTLMIADCIDYEEHKSGSRPDGVFFAGQTFLAKLTMGIATILSSIGYAVVGFTDQKVGELNEYIANMPTGALLPRDMPQYDKFMMILFFLVSIPPAIGCLLTVIPTWRYSLDDKMHTQILAELNVRRSELREQSDSEDIDN